MPHDHAHHHHIDPEAGDAKVLAAVAVNVALTAVQIVAGMVSGSLALIADGVHNLSDAASLVIAFVARKIARRPRDEVMSFGYGRAEMVAALINFVTLIVLSIWLAVEGMGRLIDPPAVEGWTVVIVAGVALVIDLVTAGLTWRLAKHSLNIRAAFLHNLADALTSLAVIVGGTLILLFGWQLVDPIITIGISAYILRHALRDIRPVIRILMNGAPPGLGLNAVKTEIELVDGIEDAHHIHLWQMDEHRIAVEAHVIVAEGSDIGQVLARVKAALSERLGISHSTLEVEAPGAGCADQLSEAGRANPRRGSLS